MADNEYNINIDSEDNYSVNIDNNDKNYSVEINPTNTYEIQLNEQGPQGNRGETGNGIVSYEKTSTDVLVDTYTITFTNGNKQTVKVNNGKGITSITGPVIDVLKDTYTIHYNDNTTSEYYVYNGKGIVNITGPSSVGLIDTYTINYNDGTTSEFEVENGNGITNISKTSTEGLVDTYTINFSNGNDTTFTVTNGEKGDIGNGISNIELDTTSGGAGEDTTDYIVNYTDGDTDTISVYNSVIEDVTATITGGVGTPSVTVTDTINPDYPNRKSFAFEFENLKGDKGDTGSTGPTGNGISSVTYNDTLSSGLVDIYDIDYTNGNTDTISITNGNGISSIENDTISSDIDTTVYDINYTDGTNDTISITNSVVGGATAIINNNVGTPDVNVTTTSDEHHPNRKLFNFQFLNLKGNTGEQGTSITNVEYIGTDPNDNLNKIYRITFSDTIDGGDDYFDYVVRDGQAGALPAIDTELSSTSTNPVQNRIVTEAINNMQDYLNEGDNISIDGIIDGGDYIWGTPISLIENVNWTVSCSNDNGEIILLGSSTVNIGTSQSPIYKKYVSVYSNGNWSTPTQIFADNISFLDIAYGNGIYIATRSNGSVIVSTDNGETWNSYTMLSYGARIIFDGEKFVVVSTNDSGVYTSSDGTSWTKISTITLYGEGVYPTSIAYGNDIYVVAGNSTMYSRDLINWSLTNNGDAYQIIFDGEKFVGYYSTSSNGNMLSSIDGINYTRYSNNSSLNNLLSDAIFKYNGAVYTIGKSLTNILTSKGITSSWTSTIPSFNIYTCSSIGDVFYYAGSNGNVITLSLTPYENKTYISVQMEGAVSTIKNNNLSANMALVSDNNGKVSVQSNVSSTKLGYLSGVTSSIQNQFNNITAKIPSTATSSNQLADQNFVNSSIATNTANFIGTFNSVAELEAYSGTLTNNDYAFVIGADASGNTIYNRYKYVASTTTWMFEYSLNNSSFTAAQWAAINSGITNGDVSLINTAVQPGDLSTVATSGSYNDLSDKPTIPENQIFIAEYGLTSYADVLAAYNARKTIFCKYLTSSSINYFSLNQKGIDGIFVFSRALDNYISKCSLNELGGWSAIGYYQLEQTSNKVTSISSSSTDTQYPSAKCVYDIVKDQNNTSRILKFWTGTKAQYDAISTKDSNTLYNITDDQDVTLTLLQTIYPVGSVYLSTNATCPLASLFGTWTLVSSGRALWTGTGSNGNTTIAAGLPNITGGMNSSGSVEWMTENVYGFGAFTRTGGTSSKATGSSSGTRTNQGFDFDASRSSSIYGNSTTVQPPAYVVNVWRRTA